MHCTMQIAFDGNVSLTEAFCHQHKLKHKQEITDNNSCYA